jgi:MFS family permease
VNRKVLAGISCILWSTTTLLTGIIDSFAMFFVFRFLLGVFESAYNPAAYGLISDYFHPNYRATVNSLYNGAIYLGGALSSLAAIMIGGLGWRGTYIVIGISGIVAGVLGLFLILEPKRGRYDAPKAKSTDERTTLQKFVAAAIECVVNPTPRWITIAASARFFAGYAIGYFMPSYFEGVWKDDIKLYSSLNAIVVSLCGFASALLGGLISDYFSQRGVHMSKAYVCIAGSLLGVPTIIMCTLSKGNFYVAIAGLALEYFFAESWIGPAITMVIDTISPENKGFAVSAFLFFATISGTISTTILGKINVAQDAAEHPEIYGRNLAYWVSIAYLVSCPFFWLAGRTYTAKKVRDEAAARQAELNA